MKGQVPDFRVNTVVKDPDSGKDRWTNIGVVQGRELNHGSHGCHTRQREAGSHETPAQGTAELDCNRLRETAAAPLFYNRPSLRFPEQRLPEFAFREPGYDLRRYAGVTDG